MTETLTERVAEMESSDVDQEANIKEIAHSVHVSNGIIKVETLSGETYNLGTIRKAASESISDIITEFESSFDVDISATVRDEIEQVVLSIKQAWDSEIGMFRLDYNLNEHGQVHEFFIPFESDYMENTTVFRIYDEDGEFVADDIEDYIGSDLAKIETTDLYVRAIPKKNSSIHIYRKIRMRENELYEEKLQKTTPYKDKKEAAVGWTEGVLAGMALFTLYTLFGFNMFTLIFMVFMVPDLYFKYVPRIVTVPISMIYASIYARRNKGEARSRKFFNVDTRHN